MSEKQMLALKDVSISFGGIKAIQNLDISVNEGEIVGLIGPNGAGKTTVFNVITGVYQVDRGRISFHDTVLNDKTPQQIVQIGIARTFQNIRLFKDMKVIENVMVGTHTEMHYSLLDRVFFTKKYKLEESNALAKSLNVLDILGLWDKKDEFAGNLPYGDQRKVEIARAISTGATLLLLDEPAAGMNNSESAELLTFIKYLKILGFTILLIEHDMSVVMNISDRVYVLENGIKIAEGVPVEVAHHPRVIKAYLGGESIVKG